MNDLIDRQVAFEALKKLQEIESDNFTNTDPVAMMTVAVIANCMEEISNLPPDGLYRVCQLCNCYDKQSCYCNLHGIWTESDFYCKAWEPEGVEE